MSEIRVKPIKPLPEPLPDGERVLWQHSPVWWPYSRRVFQLDKIALYFLVVIAWVAVSAYLSTGQWLGVLRSLAWSVPPALGVLVVLGFIAWLYARTTVYTITSKRVIMQAGLAVPSAVNLPFSKIGSADMKTFKDATGDIELSMSGPRLLYSMLWPNVRLLRLNRPTPMLRALQQPHQVADILSKALTADQQAQAVPEATIPEQQPSDVRRAAAS